MNMAKAYMQPVACHRERPEQLVLRDERGAWFLWFGDTREQLVDIPAELAMWMIDRAEMQRLPSPLMWFEPAALPVRSEMPVLSD